MKITYVLISLVSCLMLAGLTSITMIRNDKEYHFFENPQVCSGCHWEKFERWSVSQHAKAFSGDFFQKQYYELVLPSRSFDEKVADVHEGCIGCHGPSSFLSGDMIPQATEMMDNHWEPSTQVRTRAERGVFCDFCHTLEGFDHAIPFNHDYQSGATAEVDEKKADLEYPWSPHHDTKTSMIYEGTEICATCHNELNPYGVWVKATQIEYNESVYAQRGIVCQNCHMQPMQGKPAKMGQIRLEKTTDHWFGGGFTEFVEGAARVNLELEEQPYRPGARMQFRVKVQAMATGHKFPTGSVEERDVWLHVSLNDEEGTELVHIPVPVNPDDPDDKYFITSNDRVAYPSHSQLSDPIVRDALPEGDRLYHSAFLDSEGQFTYAQWFATEIIENRFDPLEERYEDYTLIIPENLSGETVYLTAVLNYRRMPDSMADYLDIPRRPVRELSRDVRALEIRP